MSNGEPDGQKSAIERSDAWLIGAAFFAVLAFAAGAASNFTKFVDLGEFGAGLIFASLCVAVALWRARKLDTPVSGYRKDSLLVATASCGAIILAWSGIATLVRTLDADESCSLPTPDQSGGSADLGPLKVCVPRGETATFFGDALRVSIGPGLVAGGIETLHVAAKPLADESKDYMRCAQRGPYANGTGLKVLDRSAWPNRRFFIIEIDSVHDDGARLSVSQVRDTTSKRRTTEHQYRCTRL